MKFISLGAKSLIKHYGFIPQTEIVILVSTIRISYLSKFGKFGRCQKGKVSFTNELVIVISYHTHKYTHTHTHTHKNRVIEILESMTWISYISMFGKCYYLLIIARNCANT